MSKSGLTKVGELLLANIKPADSYGYYIGVFDYDNKLKGVLWTRSKNKPYEVCYQTKPFNYRQLSYYGRKVHVKVDGIPKVDTEYEELFY